MDAFYAKYLLDLPPGTALPNDAGNAQQPDMGGDQVALAWTLYEQYGDRATLAGDVPGDEGVRRHQRRRRARAHLAGGPRFGDWCPPDRGSDANGGRGGPNAGNCISEVSVVNTALSYLQAADVAKAAAALGHTADADALHGSWPTPSSRRSTRHFLNAAGDTYGDGRQVTSVLPLAFGMVPAAERAGGRRAAGRHDPAPRTAATWTPGSSAPAT